jgi:hypothetical protein
LSLTTVTLVLCNACLGGEGGECHTPGCALWMNRAPDVPVLSYERPAGGWGAVLGLLANIRDEAHNTQGVIADDDDAILPSLRWLEQQAQRGVDLARRHALEEAAA